MILENAAAANRAATGSFLRGLVAGERGRRSPQNFPLGRKPMLVGLAVDAAMCGPNFVIKVKTPGIGVDLDGDAVFGAGFLGSVEP